MPRVISLLGASFPITWEGMIVGAAIAEAAEVLRSVRLCMMGVNLRQKKRFQQEKNSFLESGLKKGTVAIDQGLEDKH